MPITNDIDTLRSVLWKMNQLEGAMVRKRRGADMVHYPKLWTDLHKWLSEQVPPDRQPAVEYTRPMAQPSSTTLLHAPLEREALQHGATLRLRVPPVKV